MSRQFTWGESPTATQRDNRQRPLPTAQCSLCGIAIPIGQLVPDGGRACADIRWYCQDAQSCTERWTANLPRHPNIAPTPASLAPAPIRETPPVRETLQGRETPPVRETLQGRETPPVRETLQSREAPPVHDAPPPAMERRPGPDPVAAELRTRPAPQAWSIDPS